MNNRKKRGFVRIVLFSALAIMIAGAAFYWYDWRPREIRKSCFTFVNEAYEEAGGSGTGAGGADTLRFGYEWCLHKKGLAN